MSYPRYQVSVDQYARFRRDGFLIVPGLVPPEDIAELRQHTDDLMQGKLPQQQNRQMSERDLSKDHGVTVQDLSLGGVGFRASEKFAPGETYRITLGKGPLLLNARVKIISCRQVGHRQYHVGAEFC